MGKSSLSYDLKKQALKGLKNNKTIATYKAGCAHFAGYCKGEGIKDFKQIDRDVVQAYERHMYDRGLSPSTIHTRLAPVCRAVGIKQSEISKPRRTTDAVSRSRTSWKNEQGIQERDSSRYERVVLAQDAIGIRRAELGDLRIRNCLQFDAQGRPVDWRRDESGYPCVEVEHGKGGKYTLQRIMPDRLPQLYNVIATTRGGIQPDNLLLSREEMANHIDLHGIRAEVARASYDMYEAQIQADPAYKDQLRQELIDRYDRYNNPNRPGADAHRARYIAEIYNDKPYQLRGTNREIAEANNRPVTYDRVALMATSVYHLSHWRNSVTVSNYMLGR